MTGVILYRAGSGVSRGLGDRAQYLCACEPHLGDTQAVLERMATKCKHLHECSALATCIHQKS